MAVLAVLRLADPHHADPRLRRIAMPVAGVHAPGVGQLIVGRNETTVACSGAGPAAAWIGVPLRVVQRECDRLDGVRFPDRLSDPATFGFIPELDGQPMASQLKDSGVDQRDEHPGQLACQRDDQQPHNPLSGPGAQGQGRTQPAPDGTAQHQGQGGSPVHVPAPGEHRQ